MVPIKEGLYSELTRTNNLYVELASQPITGTIKYEEGREHNRTRSELPSSSLKRVDITDLPRSFSISNEGDYEDYETLNNEEHIHIPTSVPEFEIEEEYEPLSEMTHGDVPNNPTFNLDPLNATNEEYGHLIEKSYEIMDSRSTPVPLAISYSPSKPTLDGEHYEYLYENTSEDK